MAGDRLDYSAAGTDSGPKSVYLKGETLNIRNFIIRLIINMIAIAITAKLLPGIHVNGGVGTLLIVALVFGIINAIIKPILIVLTCPAVILTLGLFILVINGVLLLLTSAVLGSSFTVDGFGTAFI